MFKKLRNKFLILNLIVTSLVMTAAFSAVYIMMSNNTQKENQRKFENIKSSMAMYYGDFSLEAIPSQTAPSLGNSWQGNTLYEAPYGEIQAVEVIAADYTPSFSLIVDRNGGILRINSIIDLSGEDYYEAAQAAWQKKETSTINLSDRNWMYSITPVSIGLVAENNRTTIRVTEEAYQILFMDITDTQKTLQDLLVTFLFVGLVMLTVIFLVSVYFANRSIQPVALAWEKQRQFVADASHELKTPLAVITANYDALMANQDETIRSQHEWLDYMKIGTDRMGKLINDLLALATVEDENKKAVAAPFDISDAINQDMLSMEAALSDKGLALTKEISQVRMVYSDQEMVRQVFMILFENAVKYADVNGEIAVAVRRNRNRVICSVKNSGPGISREDLPRIFDRFYRSDKSRTGEGGGYGLGLSIAKSIVEQLGGDLTAESVENAWTVFTFTFEDRK